MNPTERKAARADWRALVRSAMAGNADPLLAPDARRFPQPDYWPEVHDLARRLLQALGRQEREVVTLWCSGHSYSQIAKQEEFLSAADA